MGDGDRLELDVDDVEVVAAVTATGTVIGGRGRGAAIVIIDEITGIVTVGVVVSGLTGVLDMDCFSDSTFDNDGLCPEEPFEVLAAGVADANGVEGITG